MDVKFNQNMVDRLDFSPATGLSPNNDPFSAYNAAIQHSTTSFNDTTLQVDPTTTRRVPRQRASRSFSGISDARSGIGSRLRRASTTIKAAFLQVSKHTTKDAHISTNAKHSSNETGTRRAGMFRRRRSEIQTTAMATAFADLNIESARANTHPEPPLVPYDALQGSAARAFAARENERLAVPKTIVRRDSNIGLLSEERDRESGINISMNTSAPADGLDQSQIRREDPLTVLPSELMSSILSYLDASSLQAAELVSKNWRLAAADLYVWRSVFLRKYGRIESTSTLPTPVGGRGLGKKGRACDQDWKKMYKARSELGQNWKNGNATAIYLNGHTDSVYCVQYDEDKIVTGSRDRTIRIWDMHTFKCLKVIGGPGAFEHDRRESVHVAGPSLATQAVSIQTSSLNAHDPSIYHVPDYYHEASVLCLQYDEEIMVTGSSDNTLIVWDVLTWQPIRRLFKHDAGVLDIAFDKQKLVSCSKDTTICVWSRTTGTLLQQLAGHRGPVNAVQLRGDLIVSASGEGCAKLWNLGLSNGVHGGARCVKEFWSRDRGLACVEFSNDAQYVLAGGNDMVVYKFSTATGECVATLEGHHNLVRSLYLDGANGRIVSGSYDLSLRVWDYESGEETIHFPNWTTSWMLSAKSDYRRIVSTSQDGRALIMDFGWAVEGVHLLED